MSSMDDEWMQQEILDNQLIIEDFFGGLVGFEPTIFRATSSLKNLYYPLIISWFQQINNSFGKQINNPCFSNAKLAIKQHITKLSFAFFGVNNNLFSII